MSKPPIRVPDPPPHIEISYAPDVEQCDRAAEWCNEIRRAATTPVTARTIKKAVINRELPRTILMGKMYFSTADLWVWLMSRRGFPADNQAMRS